MLYSLILSCLVLVYCVVSIAELIVCNLSRLVLGAKQTNLSLTTRQKFQTCSGLNILGPLPGTFKISPFIRLNSSPYRSFIQVGEPVAAAAMSGRDYSRFLGQEPGRSQEDFLLTDELRCSPRRQRRCLNSKHRNPSFDARTIQSSRQEGPSLKVGLALKEISTCN